MKNEIVTQHNRYGEPYEVRQLSGNDIETIITETLQYIRPKSRFFYEKEIRSDLDKEKRSLVDFHAGMGMGIEIVLEKNI